MLDSLLVSRRRFLGGSAALLSALSLAPRSAWSADGSTLRVRTEGDIGTLDPAYMNGRIEEIVMRAIYTSLVTLGDVREGSHLKPWAAEVLEQVDPLTLKFTLRDGITWSNGYGPLTADDVKFSFERIANPETKSPWAYMFEKLDHVEVVDNHTGLIHLVQPFAPLKLVALPWYGGHIVSRKATEAAGGKFTTEPPAVCGPYKIDHWSPKEKLVLTANPDWPGPATDFDKVELIIVEDIEAALLAYEAGELDYTRVSIAASKRLHSDPPADTTLVETQSSRYVWISLNVEHPKLADPRVRKALQYAFDADSILTGAYNGLVPRSAGTVQPGTFGAREKNIIQKPDYDKARALLAEAGAEGLELDLAIMNTTTDMAIAQIMQATMLQAGITINIQPYDEGVYWTLGDQSSGDSYKNLQLVLMGFLGGIDPSENLVWFRPDQVGVYNWSRWSNDEFEKLYQEGLKVSDEKRRGEIYRRMQDLMEESGAFIFLTHEPLVVVHRSSVKPLIVADTLPTVQFFRKA